MFYTADSADVTTKPRIAMFARLTRTLSQARQSIAGLLAADGDDDGGGDDVELDAAAVWAQCVAANAQAADAENLGTYPS